MITVLGSLFSAFALSYFSYPTIIKIAKAKMLFDIPNTRSSHVNGTPYLGGIGILISFLFNLFFWTPGIYLQDMQYMLCASLVIIVLGIKDDIFSMPPLEKLLGQFLTAIILVFFANLKITSLYGLFGIYGVSAIWSNLLSLFTIIAIINGLNLIDGINGLASGITMLITAFFGIWFTVNDLLPCAFIAATTFGAVSAFFVYNKTPAKIFLGDAGSLFLGLICSVLTINFIEAHNQIELPFYGLEAVPNIAMSILVLPLFDTLRVFMIRIFRGRSPLTPDRHHLHHLLIDSGLTHMQATGILIAFNVLFIFMAVGLYPLDGLYSLVILIVFCLIATFLLLLIARRNRKKKYIKRMQLRKREPPKSKSAIDQNILITHKQS